MTELGLVQAAGPYQFFGYTQIASRLILESLDSKKQKQKHIVRMGINKILLKPIVSV